jgi:4a-hydroxytetrahydrobiopterin dehydratase
MALLSQERVTKELKTLKGWALKGDEIRKVFELPDFARALIFVNSVAFLAEQANHHPDIDIRWNKVTLSLSTHSAGGLTVKDIHLAREVEKLLSVDR